MSSIPRVLSLIAHIRGQWLPGRRRVAAPWHVVRRPRWNGRR